MKHIILELVGQIFIIILIAGLPLYAIYDCFINNPTDTLD